jgi:hypothetical protein
MRWKGPMMFDLELVTVFFNLLGYGVCPIVRDDFVGHSKAADDVVFDELLNLSCSNCGI